MIPSQPSEVPQPGPRGWGQDARNGQNRPEPDRWLPGLGQGEGRGLVLTGGGVSSGEMRTSQNQAELLAALRRERAKCHGAVHFKTVKMMMNFYMNFTIKKILILGPKKCGFPSLKTKLLILEFVVMIEKMYAETFGKL